MAFRFYIYISLFLVLGVKAQTIIHSSNYDFIDKTILLKVKPSFKSFCDVNSISHPSFLAYTSVLGVYNLHKKFPYDESPLNLKNNLGQDLVDVTLIYEFNYTQIFSVEKVVSKLMSTGLFCYVEPHIVPNSLYAPSDPFANPTDQYHLLTINAFNAWNINKGDSAIVIGITDTGTELTHSDLTNAIKRNYADVIDGIDNDGDGFTDNYKGWDLGMNDNDATYQGTPHGVHVGGIAAGSTDNGIGIAGVGFECKFLPVKIADASGSLVAAYEGIKYAADHGCSIVNCSWGGNGASQFGQDMVTYATINKNCLVVAAAGNGGADTDFYPASYEYVFSVANTTSTDVKHSTSNYGYQVDVAAPGSLINSTWSGNSYTQLTGTSMASPVVAGAAGIVKKQFPSYNGLQIAERLKVTADNIYPVNPSFINKLGSGRINLFRALTDPPSPSVVFSNKNISDHNDESFIAGDTLFIIGTFINYLNPTSALNVTVTPLSPYAVSVDNTTSIGVLNTLASFTNTADPFRFKLTGIIPINQAINFEVTMQDGAYLAKQFFTVYINVDYINITNNDISTTATSRGRIGYNQDGQIQGLGFNYSGKDLMFDAGLMIGKDSSHVSDCNRGALFGGSNDNDFYVMTRIARNTLIPFSDFDTKAKMNDNLSVSPLNVEVNQNTFSWSTAPNRKFVIWEYYIKNTHATDTLKQTYAGICVDWDIDGATFSQNKSNYDVTSKTGYSYYSGTSGKYAGIKLLTNTAGANFYAIDNVTGGAGGVDISNGFDTKEKYKTLSTNRLVAGVSGLGADVLNVMSTGPYLIEPGQTIKVAFALVVGDSLSDLIISANQAQVKYNGVITSNDISISKNESVFIYPNPTSNYIQINQPTNEFDNLELFSITGELLFKTNDFKGNQTIDLSMFSAGVYFIKLSNHQKSVQRKIVVMK